MFESAGESNQCAYASVWFYCMYDEKDVASDSFATSCRPIPLPLNLYIKICSMYNRNRFDDIHGLTTDSVYRQLDIRVSYNHHQRVGVWYKFPADAANSLEYNRAYSSN